MDDAVIGVDAHRRTHTLVAVDQLGRKLAQKTIGTSSDSHAEAVRWARTRFGTAVVWVWRIAGREQNTLLKRLLAEAELEKDALREVAKGKF